MALSREQILTASPALRVERVQVPEWGGEVCVREMTAGERDRWDAWQIDHTGPDRFNDLRARLLVTVLCDDAGARLFSDADIEHVSRMPAAIMPLYIAHMMPLSEPRRTKKVPMIEVMMQAPPMASG